MFTGLQWFHLAKPVINETPNPILVKPRGRCWRRYKPSTTPVVPRIAHTAVRSYCSNQTGDETIYRPMKSRFRQLSTEKTGKYMFICCINFSVFLGLVNQRSFVNSSSWLTNLKWLYVYVCKHTHMWYILAGISTSERGPNFIQVLARCDRRTYGYESAQRPVVFLLQRQDSLLLLRKVHVLRSFWHK